MEEKGLRKTHDSEGERRRQATFSCKYCKSDTREDVVRAAIWGNRRLVAIEGIPARVCERCGEQFYSEETAQKIQRLIADPTAKAKEEILVPVFSLLEVRVPEKRNRGGVLREEEVGDIPSTFKRTEQREQVEEANQERQTAYACEYCGSGTYEDLVKSVLWTESGLVAIEGIPARVCRKCGEQFYDDVTSWNIAKLKELGFPAERAKREILVPVFSVAEVRLPRGGNPLPEREEDGATDSTG